jgi:protein-S-isoprenylcysteine O-methyltransferase Ste14
MDARPEGEAGGAEPGAPSPWRVARAILPLPFMATVVVPALILAIGDEGTGWEAGGVVAVAAVLVGGALVGAGLGLFVATVRLFAILGRGTLAPWDPPRRLVVRGPYRHLRHPMISGVALVLAGEALALGSSGIAIWLAAFVAVNSVYLPLVEEPALVRRFGADYERYMENVRRWVPRLRPWDPET